MLLYLVRHGETELNERGVYQGYLPTPLNETGQKQARQLGEALRNVPFKECWTSDLPRAVQTAKLILGPYHRKTPVELEPLLTDRAMGELEGKPWIDEKVTAGKGVESDQELAIRLHTFLSDLIQSHTPSTSPLSSPRIPSTPQDQGSGCVLVVTHEACILSLLQILVGDQSATEYFPKEQHQELDQAVSGSPTDLTDIPKPNKFPKRSAVVQTHIPLTVDVGLQCGNTAVCVVRVWWEEEGVWPERKLEAKGRVEVWGDVMHLEDDDNDDDVDEDQA